MPPFVIHYAPSGYASVIETNLEAHYSFDGASPLADRTANGRGLSVQAGTPPGANSDGYELNVSDAVAWTDTGFFLTSHTAFTLQVAVIPEGNDSFQDWLQVQDSDTGNFRTLSTGYMEGGAGMASTIIDDGDNLLRGATGTEASGYTGTGVVLTCRWDGSTGDLKTRVNKGADTTVTEVGALSVDQIRSAAGNANGHTLVYALVYSSVLSDVDCDANYDAIKAYVNSRPNVSLA